MALRLRGPEVLDEIAKYLDIVISIEGEILLEMVKY